MVGIASSKIHATLTNSMTLAILTNRGLILLKDQILTIRILREIKAPLTIREIWVVMIAEMDIKDITTQTVLILILKVMVITREVDISINHRHHLDNRMIKVKAFQGMII